MIHIKTLTNQFQMDNGHSNEFIGKWPWVAGLKHACAIDITEFNNNKQKTLPSLTTTYKN